MTISVVIPTLNEEPSIEDAVRSAAAGADEVLVVDGGSHDHTRERASCAGAVVLEKTGGRGPQLDHGARAARGEWIVFLHADTRLGAGWAAELRALPGDVVGGAFRFALASPRRAFRVIELGVRLRCALLKMPYGDQGLFARRDAYVRAGGFPSIPLMEDVAFVAQLRRTGRLAFLRTPAVTSARRWERDGVLATTARNWTFLTLYAAGWPPERLAAAYTRRDRRAAQGET